LAERDHDLTLKAISLDSGIPYDTLRSYAARDPAMMPVSALLKLVDVVPDYLLSQLLDPVNRRLEIVSNENGDIDELGREAATASPPNMSTPRATATSRRSTARG
jgi:hypothetical protein